MARLSGHVPVDDHGGIEAPPPAKVPPRAKFLLRWHPDAWDIIGGRLLPRLGDLPIVDGVNGVRGKQTGMAIAASKERGWTVLPTDIQGTGTNYLRVHDTLAGPQTHWATQWTELHAGSGHIGSDTDGYVSFLVWLVEEGHIPAPAAHIVGRVRERLQLELEEARNKAITVPSYRADVDRLTAVLDNLAPPQRRVEEAEKATKSKR